MSDLTIGVNGMTCGHCAQTVTGVVQQVPGVAGVDVDLDGGQVTVTGNGVDQAAVRAAIVDAGYETAE